MDNDILIDDLPVKIGAQVPRGSREGEFCMEKAIDSKNKRTQNVDFIAFALSAGIVMTKHYNYDTVFIFKLSL